MAVKDGVIGMELELVIMDVPTGHSICRISRSEKFTFPDCTDTFATDLIPLLEIIWKGKQVMITRRVSLTFSSIDDRRSATSCLFSGEKKSVMNHFVSCTFKHVVSKLPSSRPSLFTPSSFNKSTSSCKRLITTSSTFNH